jgi:hypothetical protein
MSINSAQKDQRLAEAIGDAFISANEADANFEAANIVDGLFAIARAIQRLADAVNAKREA